MIARFLYKSIKSNQNMSTKTNMSTVFNTIIENDRKMLCELMKSQGYYDDAYEQVYSKLMTAPIPELPKNFQKMPKIKKEKSDKPRRISGYILFSNDFRSKAKNEGKDINPKDSIKEAGHAWKNLDEASRKVWTDLSNEKFNEAVDLYKETHPDYDPTVKSSKMNKDTVQVPRMKSPYILFVSHLSKSGTIQNGENLMTTASAKWAEFNDSDKEPFIKESLETKKEANRFRDFTEHIRSKLIDEGVSDDIKCLEKAAVEKWNKLSRQEKDKFNGEITKYNAKKNVKTLIPTKKTAYNLFVAKFDGVVEEGQNKMTVAAAMWKELTEDEKKPYEEMSYKTSEEFEKFKGFVEENESKIREEIKEELENEKDTKKHKKMIHRVAAKMWVDVN